MSKKVAVGTGDIAQAFGVSRRTVTRWIVSGLLGSVKHGTQYRVLERHVRAFLKLSARAALPPALEALFSVPAGRFHRRTPRP